MIPRVRSHLVSEPSDRALALRPFRAMRPAADGDALARLLSPPYDVITDADRAALLAGSPDNAVTIVAPPGHGFEGESGYVEAAKLIDDRVRRNLYRVDEEPALYVYEMTDTDGTRTRGLMGAVELRDPSEGVILPHEDVMGGPVADRLALMLATSANLEPIYLLVDRPGAAADAVRTVDDSTPLADTRTPDGIRHRLWAITDPVTLAEVASDLAGQRAVIADGHHRYATYRELQSRLRTAHGPGPWDQGLALVVNTADFGPSVHPIHRVLRNVPLDAAVAALPAGVLRESLSDVTAGLAALGHESDFAVVLSDGSHSVLVRDPDHVLGPPADDSPLDTLDVTVVHQRLVREAWRLPDDVDHVGYAHDTDQAIIAAQREGGTAVLLRATPASAVIAVARAGRRMPRKSTLFMPKPASGLVMRRFADEAPSQN